MSKFSPIVLFCYNRTDCLAQTVTALLKNPEAAECDLVIFSDGAKNPVDQEKVDAVRKYIKNIQGFKNIEIHEAEKNQGLANSIIAGVTDVVNRYGRVIVLEDDIVVAPYFLYWMNQALDLYEKEEAVAGIHAWTPPDKFGSRPEIYFIREIGCLGWAAWKRGWEIFEPDGRKLLERFTSEKMIKEFDVYGTYPYYQMLKDQVDGKVDSWAIRWYASVFLNNKLGLQPGRSLVAHIGYQSGTHFQKDSFMPEDIVSTEMPELKVIPLKCNEKILRKVHRKYNNAVMQRGIFHRGIAFCKRQLQKFSTNNSGIITKRMKIMKKTINACITYVAVHWPSLQKITVLFFSVIGDFFAKLSFYMFKYMFQFQWCANHPENFDHRIDLYYQWQVRHNPLWIERGVFNVLALQMFHEPVVVELCCGDGFYTKYFYSINAKKIFACDLDKKIINIASHKNGVSNIHYCVADIRTGIQNIFSNQIEEKKVTNIIWDAAIEHFTEKEIFMILEDIKNTLTPDGIVSGYTIIERKDHQKHLEHHEREFASKEDLRSFFTPYFKNVHIIETHYAERTNLYFFASDGALPFSVFEK
ncbi:MAG: glycosyltransferase [Lentisphaeria bacterium]|nr:glycosyltransferase [Lentisphaeria bacterium]MBO7329832.1 glycosyltransferase [Lentisphaeria bacterium]